jgi:hypothetical protein
MIERLAKRTDRLVMLIRQARNDRVIRYLERKSCIPREPDVRPPREKSLDYWECGAHPDIVERLWDGLGKTLPVECRQVVLGSPALVHPRSGVVLALAIGTQYGIRIPDRLLQEGLPAGVRTKTSWSTGGQMDIQDELGADWVFGTWNAAEDAWCREVFQEQEIGGGVARPGGAEQQQ